MSEDGQFESLRRDVQRHVLTVTLAYSGWRGPRPDGHNVCIVASGVAMVTSAISWASSSRCDCHLDKGWLTREQLALLAYTASHHERIDTTALFE